eukprot:14270000-Ditylum_brightwellii.AAC.1
MALDPPFASISLHASMSVDNAPCSESEELAAIIILPKADHSATSYTLNELVFHELQSCT